MLKIVLGWLFVILQFQGTISTSSSLSGIISGAPIAINKQYRSPSAIKVPSHPVLRRQPRRIRTEASTNFFPYKDINAKSADSLQWKAPTGFKQSVFSWDQKKHGLIFRVSKDVGYSIPESTLDSIQFFLCPGGWDEDFDSLLNRSRWFSLFKQHDCVSIPKTKFHIDPYYEDGIGRISRATSLNFFELSRFEDMKRKYEFRWNIIALLPPTLTGNQFRVMVSPNLRVAPKHLFFKFMPDFTETSRIALMKDPKTVDDAWRIIRPVSNTILAFESRLIELRYQLMETHTNPYIKNAALTHLFQAESIIRKARPFPIEKQLE